MGEKGQILLNFSTGQAGPVNKKITGPRQYLLATGQQASAKLYTANETVGADGQKNFVVQYGIKDTHTHTQMCVQIVHTLFTDHTGR